jgi:DNA-binding transcriptional MerR regulator
MDLPELLTEAEVAELFRRTVDSLRRWRRKGTGPRWYRLGNRVLYDRRAVEEFLADRARGAA